MYMHVGSMCVLCSDCREIKKRVRVRAQQGKQGSLCVPYPTADLSLCCTCAALGSVVCMASYCCVYMYMYLSSR